jgi:F-type H+-transporting ATPase subunit b
VTRGCVGWSQQENLSVPKHVIAKVVALSVVGLLIVPAFAAEGEQIEGLDLFQSSNIGNFIFTLIIFGLFIALLGKYAWGPILKTLKEREDNIHDALVEAKREREAADVLLKEYETKIDKAREEATAIVEEGKRDAEDVRRRIHEEAQAEAKQMIERAKREIQLASDTAVKDLYDKTAEIAVTVAGAIVERELSISDHEQLVTDALRKIDDQHGARLN